VLLQRLEGTTQLNFEDDEEVEVVAVVECGGNALSKERKAEMYSINLHLGLDLGGK
jgi:hypothetical protein